MKARLAAIVALAWVQPLALAAQEIPADEVAVEASETRSAETPVQAPSSRPWAEGVGEAEQAQALATFQRGNDAYTANDYRMAVELYREALGHWSHPAIHGNLSVALVYLDRPIEALNHVSKALEYGPQPLGEVIHRQLLTNRRLLRAQLSQIEVECEVDGAEIVLDGETIFRSPAIETHVARAGSHRVVASKPGYLTFTHEFNAPSGESVRVVINLVPLADAARFERRWSEWVPWTVVGGGALLLVTGAILQNRARNEIESYRDDLARLCPSGCVEAELPSAVRDQEESGVRRNRSAITLLSLGGALAAAGGVLLILNSPRRVEVGSDGAPLSNVRVAPMASREVLGASLSGDF